MRILKKEMQHIKREKKKMVCENSMRNAKNKTKQKWSTKADINEKTLIRVISMKNCEWAHHHQMRDKQIRERMVILRPHQWITVYSINYNLELEAFHYDSMKKYNEHWNIIIKNRHDIQVRRLKKLKAKL